MELLRAGSLEKLLLQLIGPSQLPYRAFLPSYLHSLQPQDHLPIYHPVSLDLLPWNSLTRPVFPLFPYGREKAEESIYN